MCAALAARKDPAEELELAVSLINRVVDGFDGLRLGVHVCRGQLEPGRIDTVQRHLPATRPVPGAFERPATRARIRHRARRRVHVIRRQRSRPRCRQSGGPKLSNRASRSSPRSCRPSRFYPATRIFLNPDCGFGTFSNRPVNSTDVATSNFARWSLRRQILRTRVAQGPTTSTTNRRGRGNKLTLGLFGNTVPGSRRVIDIAGRLVLACEFDSFFSDCYWRRSSASPPLSARLSVSVRRNRIRSLPGPDLGGSAGVFASGLRGARANGRRVVWRWRWWQLRELAAGPRR